MMNKGFNRLRVSIFYSLIGLALFILISCGGGGGGDAGDKCPGQKVCGSGCMPTSASCCPDGAHYCDGGKTCNSSNQCVSGSGGTCNNGGFTVDCASYNMTCGQTRNGITVVGWPIPVCCLPCPAGMRPGGRDNITAGGPYEQCVCPGY